MFDLISIGDAAVDHFFKISDAHVELDKGEEELCLSLGSKLPVETYEQILGGNNANNAVGATRLGLKTAIYLNVGSDQAGQFTLSKLKEEGVDSRYVVKNEGMDSNVSALISFKGERTILTYHQDFKYQLPDLDKTRWVYLSSMGKPAQTSEFIGQVENYLERTSAQLFYNPGTMELARGLTKFPKLLSLAKVLILNKEEAGHVLGINHEGKTDIKKMLSSLVNLGPRMAIITDAIRGSFGFDGENFWKLGIFFAKVVDTTGAGDAYATGVLAGLFHGEDLHEAMRWGAANGASVVEQIGPQKGLLTKKEMQKKIAENIKIIAQKVS
ncbi:MAG: carbohydrate kinase family protein [Microgenomates group bacterium]|jgi:sugar/nucleoside kinase (ribokinase family)